MRAEAGPPGGPAASSPAELVARIIRHHQAGFSMWTIAAALIIEGVPTARGGATWTHSTVQAVLRGQDAARLISA
jgi:hypothetical protein